MAEDLIADADVEPLGDEAWRVHQQTTEQTIARLCGEMVPDHPRPGPRPSF
jgi:hypothetical protein